MKKNELEKKLKKLKIPNDAYKLDGKAYGRDDERLCLDYENGEWQVYFIERGNRTTDKRFSTEDEACQYILNELILGFYTIYGKSVDI